MSGKEEGAAPARKPAVPGALTTSCGVVSYLRAGSGRPLVLLHDLAQSRESFEALSALLRERYQVIAADLLGHGGSDVRPADLSIAAQADAVVEVIDDLRLEGVVLVGHSLGGAVSLRVAASRPDLVSRLVLLSAGSYHYRFPLSWRLARFRAAWSLLGLVGGPGAVQRSLRLARVSTGASQPASDPLDTREGWAALGRAFRQSANEASFIEMEDIVEHRLGHPALVVWGSENRILPAASARVIFRGRRNVKFIEIAGAAHAVHEEEPAIVADLIRDFLE